MLALVPKVFISLYIFYAVYFILILVVFYRVVAVSYADGLVTPTSQLKNRGGDSHKKGRGVLVVSFMG